MKVELVVIGNEVLAGFTVNTNGAFISQKLTEKGYTVTRQEVLPDEPTVLQAGLCEALERADVVITTGGLGPTLDDLTRQTAATLYASDFCFNAEVAADIKRRFGADHPLVKDQATVPSKAEIMLNSVGTAPGLIFREEGKALVMLPGVPNEMRPMLTGQAIPYLQEHFPLAKRSFSRTIHLYGVPELGVDPLIRQLRRRHSSVEFGIYPGLGVLSVRMTVQAAEKAAADAELDPPAIAIETQFATHCFTSVSGGIEEAVQRVFVENGWTLALAESCTGGSLASQITKLSGASAYFLGSVVAYSNRLKTDLLDVPESLITEKGAVSAEVVEAMVEGALKVSGSDFALAVSGIAGPTGGTPEKPVGTVWCAVCRRGEKPHTWLLHAHGTRQMIITRSVNSLLGNLLMYTKETSLL